MKVAHIMSCSLADSLKMVSSNVYIQNIVPKEDLKEREPNFVQESSCWLDWMMVIY